MNPTHKYDSKGNSIGQNTRGNWGSRGGGGFSRKGW